MFLLHPTAGYKDINRISRPLYTGYHKLSPLGKNRARKLIRLIKLCYGFGTTARVIDLISGALSKSTLNYVENTQTKDSYRSETSQSRTSGVCFI